MVRRGLWGPNQTGALPIRLRDPARGLRPSCTLPPRPLALQIYRETGSKQTRGEAYAFRDMVNHVALPLEFNARFCGPVAQYGGVGRLRNLIYPPQDQTDYLRGKVGPSLPRHPTGIRQWRAWRRRLASVCFNQGPFARERFNRCAGWPSKRDRVRERAFTCLLRCVCVPSTINPEKIPVIHRPCGGEPATHSHNGAPW